MLRDFSFRDFGALELLGPFLSGGGVGGSGLRVSGFGVVESLKILEL